MGAGVGQKRRVNARTKLANGALHYDAAAWATFVETSCLDGQSVVSYYLGEGLSDEYARGSQQVQEIMNELFLDLLSVGAVTLPRGRARDEYELSFSAATLTFRDHVTNCEANLDTVVPCRIFRGLIDPLFSSTDLRELVEDMASTLQLVSHDRDAIWV